MESTRKHWFWLAVGLWMVSPANADNPPYRSNVSALANGALEISPGRAETVEEAFNKAIDHVKRRSGSSQPQANAPRESASDESSKSTAIDKSATPEDIIKPETLVAVAATRTPDATTVIPRGNAAPNSDAAELSESNTTLVRRGSNLSVPWYRGPFVALAGVLVLIVGLTIAARKYLPSARPVAPDALAVVGRTAISAKQSAVLLHVGKRVVLVGVAADHVQTLAEITDPDEVAMLLGKTRGKQTAVQSFDRALATELDHYDDSNEEVADESNDAVSEYVPVHQSDDGEQVSETLRIARGELASLRTRINELQSA